MAELKRKRATSPNETESISGNKKLKAAANTAPVAIKKKSAKAPGFSKEIFSETSYIIKNGVTRTVISVIVSHMNFLFFVNCFRSKICAAVLLYI